MRCSAESPQELLNNYPKLKLAMSMAEVEKYPGKPDFGWGKPIAAGDRARTNG